MTFGVLKSVSNAILICMGTLSSPFFARGMIRFLARLHGASQYFDSPWMRVGVFMHGA
jgi:hypothetical protein